MRKAFVLVLVLVSCNFGESQVRADDPSPSLQETMGWLVSAVKGNGAVVKYVSIPGFRSDYHSTIYEEIRNDECILGYTTRYRVGNSATRNEKVAVQLGHLDPLTINVSEARTAGAKQDPVTWNVVASVHSSKPSVTAEECFPGEVSQCKPIQRRIWWIEFMDKELAERFSRALKHAVQLCGGKVDPF